ncbi:MAG TPA: response regulator [Gemmatimonadaceae bacterium]|nr:response regulator [Gemmatimonadaceae bacterium]
MTTTRHILVADDEPHIGRIIKMKLEQGPFRVTLAFDGREALEILQKEEPIDLVLLDLMMPFMSGLDVLAKIRASERWRDVPCMVLTAAGQETQHQRAMELGANDFLTKPFSPKRLYGRVSELLGVAAPAQVEERE